MKLIVFGPTGGTGRELVKQALAGGHEVTAFARNPQSIERHAQLSVVTGDIFDATAVDRAVAGHDAVLSALGGRPWRRMEVCSRAIRNITAAMPRHRLRRIIAMSTFGAGETRAHVGWVARNVIFGLVLRT